MKAEIMSGLAAVCLMYSTPSQDLIKQSMNAVVMNKTITYEKSENKIVENESMGTGFVMGDKYYTADHVVSQYEKIFITPIMQVAVPIQKENEITFIDGIPLEEIVNSRDTDVAIFRLPKELCAKYCNQSTYSLEPLEIGQQVYFIGNPKNTGKVFRMARIGRLDAPKQMNGEYSGAIGLDTYTIFGDSGSPVFNMKGEVIGVIQALVAGMGYFKPIRQFIKAVEAVK